MSTTSSPRKRPLALPTLPPSTTNPAHLDISSELRQTLTSLLFTTPSSIPAMQSAFSSSLASSGWTSQLQDYIFQVLRAEPGIGERELFERVLRKVRARLAVGGEGSGDVNDDDMDDTAGRKGVEGVAEDRAAGSLPPVPASVVEAGVKAVKGELEKTCVYVDDEDDWND